MNKSKIKLIALSILIIVVSAGVALGLSKALFEDRKTLDTTISMGTLNLQVGDEGPTSIPLDFENMSLDEFRTVIFEVDNVGSIEGNFWVRGVITETGNTLDPESEGDLKNCARLGLYRIRDDGLEENIINNMVLRNIEADFDSDAGTTNDVAINDGPVEMHLVVNTLDCYNHTMGDYISASLDFYLTQTVD
jgi:hypothetical protein